MIKLQDNFNNKTGLRPLPRSFASNDPDITAAEKVAERKHEQSALEKQVMNGTLPVNDDGSVPVNIIVNLALILEQRQALETDKKAKEQAFINQVLRELDNWFEAHLNLMSGLMNKIEDKQREIDEAKRQLSSYVVAMNADSLDDLTDKQRADVTQALKQYADNTGRKVNMDDKAERDRVLELIMLANEMEIAHKCGEQKDLINAYDKASAEYDKAWQAAKNAGYENRNMFDQLEKLDVRRKTVETSPEQPTGVDGEVAIFMQKFAELEKSGISSDDIKYLLSNVSDEAQKDIKATAEVQKHLNPPKTEQVLELQDKTNSQESKLAVEQEATQPTKTVGFDFG